MILALAFVNQFGSVVGEIEVYRVSEADIRSVYGDAMEDDKFHKTTMRYLRWVKSTHGDEAAEAEAIRLWDIVFDHQDDYDLVWYLRGDGEL